MDSSYTSSSTKPLYRGTQVIWYIVGLLEVLLAFRFFLKLFGANTYAGFTQFIYGVTHPFASPFLDVFRVTRVEGAAFEWTTLLAMFVYLLIGWGIARLLLMSKTVSTPEAAAKLEEQDE